MAARRNTTFRAIVESALRDALAAEKRPAKRFRLRTHTFAGKGLRSGLSWDDWNSIRGLIYEGRGG